MKQAKIFIISLGLIFGLVLIVLVAQQIGVKRETAADASGGPEEAIDFPEPANTIYMDAPAVNVMVHESEL